MGREDGREGGEVAGGEEEDFEVGEGGAEVGGEGGEAGAREVEVGEGAAELKDLEGKRGERAGEFERCEGGIFVAPIFEGFKIVYFRHG